ncbi:MAG: restriction endonuclease subunit S [Nitrospirota bacterium]|nr:restriction endonuclease subunit S [Nitrospirota bacterium]
MSDREQLGGPQGWKRTTLGEALPIHYGKARNDRYGTVRVNTPVYGSSGKIDTFNRALTSGPSLIIGRKGNVGSTYFSPEPCWPIDTVYFAEASEEEDLRFFKYLLDHLQLVRKDRSTAVPGLSRDDYNATEVLVPELDQQRLVVAELEKQFSRLDEAVANLKRVKANLKRYKAAVLKAAVEGKLTEEWRKQHPEVEPASKLLERILAERQESWQSKKKVKEPFEVDTAILPLLPKGWIWASLEAISEAIGGFAFESKKFTATGFQVLKMANIRMGRIDVSQRPSFIQDVDADVVAKYGLIDGDLVVTLTGTRKKQDYGYVAVIRHEKGLLLNQRIARLRPADGVLPQFLALALQSEDYRNRFFDYETGNVGQGNVGMGAVTKVPILLAPLAEQEQIVAEVERRLSVIDELEVAVQANLTRADRLRQSILSQAFSGQLLGGDTKRAPDILPTFSIAAESQSAYGKDGHAGR